MLSIPLALAVSFTILAIAILVLGLQLARRNRRIRALESLHEVETRYQTAFEQSMAAMLIIDADQGQILDANQAAINFYGWSREQLLGQRIQQINVLPPQEVAAEMERARSGGRNHFEFRHQLADGTIREVEVFSGPLLLKGRWQLFTIVHDVTERRRAEVAMRESEETFALTFQRAPILMTLSDVETGTYLDVNEAFLRISGHTREEVLGRTSIELGWVAPEGRDRMKRELQEQGRIDGMTLDARTRDGAAVTCLVNAELVPIHGVKRMLAAALDMTAQLKAQRQIQHAQKMDSLGNLAGGVAHDMNNVLGAILALASVKAMAHPEDSPTRRAFETISAAAERGGEMVRRLLAFARTSPAQDKDVDLNGILREEVLLLERTTLAKVKLELDLEDALAPIRGDAGDLAHAIMNLCINAVDAMPDSGTLILRTRNLAGAWVEVSVEDNGCGMSREVLDQALDPYFTTKPEGQGTGLGLALVYSTVKAHGGTLDVTSRPGQGTIISMRFPACEPQQAPQPGPAPEAAAPLGSLAVLLVDDDDLLQSSVSMMLEAMGHTVNVAGTGEAALALIQGGLEPQFVLLDMNMPGLGGAATLPLIRALRPDLPVVVATGRADQTALDLVARHAKVALLTKPFSMKELQSQIEALA